jgi:hypothetical protein
MAGAGLVAQGELLVEAELPPGAGSAIPTGSPSQKSCALGAGSVAVLAAPVASASSSSADDDEPL